MPIEIHCVHCNKLVRAPDNAAGRRGKCPYCHNEVYVPTPPEEIEELDLAPEDDDWRKRKRALDEEAKAIGDALRHEKEVPEDGAPGGGEQLDDIPLAGDASAPAGGSTSSRQGVEGLVIEFLVAMKNSQLDKAEEVAGQLKGQSAATQAFVQQLSMDPMPPPEVGDLAPGVMKGLLKDLVSRL
jgi:phage FluMu protein Com